VLAPAVGLVLAPRALEWRVLERLEAPLFDPLGWAGGGVDALALAAALLVALVEAPPHAASSRASRTTNASAAALRCLLRPTSAIYLLVA
jgi:hypothetical protein